MAEIPPDLASIGSLPATLSTAGLSTAGLPKLGVPAGLHDAGSPWWLVLVAGIPSFASGVWVFWRWWVERGDSRSAVALTREHGLLRELETQRAALSKEQAELFDRIRGELTRCQVRLLEVEHDRDRGWDLARWWNRRAHELRHAGMSAQTAAQNITVMQGRGAIGRPATPWPDMSLPGLEDPQ